MVVIIISPAACKPQCILHLHRKLTWPVPEKYLSSVTSVFWGCFPERRVFCRLSNINLNILPSIYIIFYFYILKKSEHVVLYGPFSTISIKLSVTVYLRNKTLQLYLVKIVSFSPLLIWFIMHDIQFGSVSVPFSSVEE